MNNGWYKVRSAKTGVQVLEVYQNQTSEGSVNYLQKCGCDFEKVYILTESELMRVVKGENPRVLSL